MAENDAPERRIPREILERELIETLAGRIAGKIFYQVGDKHRREELQELLVEFAEEIQRASVEP